MAGAALAHLRRVASPVEAKVLAARLGADGIPVHLSGGVDGPYPVGPVDLWVLASDLDEAAGLLLVDEAEWVVSGACRGAERAGRGPARAGRGPWLLYAAAPLAGLALAGLVLRLG